MCTRSFRRCVFIVLPVVTFMLNIQRVWAFIKSEIVYIKIGTNGYCGFLRNSCCDNVFIVCISYNLTHKI